MTDRTELPTQHWVTEDSYIQVIPMVDGEGNDFWSGMAVALGDRATYEYRDTSRRAVTETMLAALGGNPEDLPDDWYGEVE